jgi:hypothetical protein
MPRYERVETAEGREAKLPEFLEKVSEVVGRTALQQILGTADARARNSAAGALEEDARLTPLFLWTLQSTNKGLTTEDTENTEEEQEDEEDSVTSVRSVVKGFSLIYVVFGFNKTRPELLILSDPVSRRWREQDPWRPRTFVEPGTGPPPTRQLSSLIRWRRKS